MDHSRGQRGDTVPEDLKGAAGLSQARDLLRRAARITVMTGAGISVESGIPDFRGPAGLFTTNPDALAWFTRSIFQRSAEARRHFWSLRHALLDALPNPGHTAIADLERQGRLRGVVTQNIDGLHHKAGNSPELVYEVHGSVRGVECLRCGATDPVEVMLERLAAGEDDPHCTRCGGVLKPSLVMYEEQLDPEVFGAAERAAADCDVMIAVGSTLDVVPAAFIPQAALERGIPLIVVNLGRTRYDEAAAVHLEARAAAALPYLLAPE
jgi:NAD-dependent deacetylase